MLDNFNYISFGNWERVEGDIDTIQMSLGRILEHTPSDIEKRLEKLDQDALEFLQRLPTFLCSEIEAHDDNVSMLIKFCRVSSIVSGTKEITANIEVLTDYGEVIFEDLEQARSLFDADRFQLYRTHWAVRSGNLQDILKGLDELKPDVKRSSSSSDKIESFESEVRPPSRKKNILGTAKDIEGFLQLLDQIPAKDNIQTFFRGHSDASYELIPSLLRKSVNGDWQYMPSEDRLCKELLIAHHHDFEADQYCFDRLVRMQHYGLPTRLLDISGNPLIALFFACSSKSDADGEVVIFQILSDEVKYYDSDTVSCISNLSNLTHEQKDKININLDQKSFNKTETVSKLLHHIKSEKGYFEGRIIPDDLGSIVCVKAKQTNSRIKSQSGAFLLFGHEAKLPDGGQLGIVISRITVEGKAEILRQLDQLNINSKTVYPSIEQTAVHLRETYLSQRLPR